MTNGHSCEQIAALLPDFLQGSLGRGQSDLVEQHIRQCDGCRESVAVWNKLTMLPQDEPSPMLRTRFEAMLAAYQQAQVDESRRFVERRTKPLFWGVLGWQQWATGLAAAVVLLVIGFSTGRYTGKTSGMGDESNDVAVVRRELSDMRQLVVLSMLQQQSASERLRGIAYSSQEGQTDPKVLEALLSALRSDGSVDVRLAALNALSAHGKQPLVKSGLIEALQPQQSPLVQLELINLMVQMRDRNAVQQLRNIEQNKLMNPAVRQRAQWALTRLN